MESFHLIGIAFLAFACEYIDSTLGMGYGTTLTPLFIILGFNPIQIVPVVLLSELISGLLAGFFHHREGNVNFKPKATNPKHILHKLKTLGCVRSLRVGLPRELKLALLLAACSIVGTLAAVFVALNIPRFYLKLYIACLVLAMGLLILLCLKKDFKFSWLKITVLGTVASFNKGMSGGGYGPLVTSGQILSGVDGKNAVAVTSLAEALTCLVGATAYLLIKKTPLDWSLAPYVIIGAVLSVPLSAKSVKLISTKNLKLAIALLTITLGSITLIKTLSS